MIIPNVSRHGCVLLVACIARRLEVHKLVEPPHLLQSVRAFDTLGISLNTLEQFAAGNVVCFS